MPSENLPRLHVCVTCKNVELPDPGDSGTPHGQLLHDAVADLLAASADPPIRLEPVICLGNCQRGCSVTMSSPGKWAYMMGGLAPNHAGDLITYGEAFASSKNGTVFRSKRPQSLFNAIVARFPVFLDSEESSKG